MRCSASENEARTWQLVTRDGGAFLLDMSLM
jgi:hypothetical protein